MKGKRGREKKNEKDSDTQSIIMSIKYWYY